MDEPPGFEVREIGGAKGKGLFALREFKAGDVIFEENPLICCQLSWNAAYGYSSCDHCLKPLESAEENARRLTGIYELKLPYPQCCSTDKSQHTKCPECQTNYCSEDCRKQALDQYHKVLCMGSFVGDANHPLEKLQEAWRQMHYPPETSTIMLIARMIAMVKQATDKEGTIAMFSQFCHRTVNEEEKIVHKLLGDKFHIQLEQLLKLITVALYDEDCKQWFTPEGFRSLVALVGTNGQGVGTSPVSVWVKNCDDVDLKEDECDQLESFIEQLYKDLEKESGGFLNNEGSALYPLQSSCNHSCIPNAEPSFPYNNYRLMMSALTDINPEEEICVSYLDECARCRSRHSRIKILRENYLFTCTCSTCQSQINDPDVTSDDTDDSELEEMEN